MASNNAPKMKWQSQVLASGTLRQRLFVNGCETPYFIDSANGCRAHRTQGEEHGLFGSGMSEFGCAAILGSSRAIATLKHRAEQYAAQHPTP